MSTTVMSRRASQPQFDYIKNLLAERDVDADTLEIVQTYREAAMKGQLSSTRAGTLIDILKTMPYRQAAASAEPQAGVYETQDQRWFRVYLGQQSGKMLVKEIHAEHDLMGDMDVSYEYLGLATKHLPGDAVRVPLEEVKELSVRLGIQHDHCMICGHRIDVPESVDRGIGPVCAAKYE